MKINPVAGSGGSPLLCSHITSIAIGTVCVRDYSEEPLDSYQDVDLDRLRDKWVDASMRRRDYLDKKVRKIMEKKGESQHPVQTGLNPVYCLMVTNGYRQDKS